MFWNQINDLVVVQLLGHVQLFVIPWTSALQVSLSLIISQSLPKFTFIALVMPSGHLILWHHLLLMPSIFPSIRDFPSESPIHIRWPKYWSFSFSISPSNEYSGLISFRIDWFDLLAVQDSQESSPATQFKGISSLVLCLLYGPVLTTVCDHFSGPPINSYNKKKRLTHLSKGGPFLDIFCKTEDPFYFLTASPCLFCLQFFIVSLSLTL